MQLWNLIVSHPIIVSLVVGSIIAVLVVPNLPTKLFGWMKKSGSTELDKLVEQLKQTNPQLAALLNPPTTPKIPTDLDEPAYRSQLFAYIDEARDYAASRGDAKSVQSANQLLNDLFTFIPPNSNPDGTHVPTQPTQT